MPKEPDRRWRLTPRAFDGLLRRLSQDREIAAREYDAVRRRLVGFFERRDALEPETLADETIDRVARRLDEGETVDHLHAYFYGVARWVMAEWTRQRTRQKEAEGQLPVQAEAALPSAADQLQEARFSCLERCLKALPSESRRLIFSYYQSNMADRKRLAARLGMSYTGLKSQAHRIRVRLWACLQLCLDAQDGRADGISDACLGHASMRTP